MLLKCRSTFRVGCVRLLAELVLHGKGQMRLHAFQNGVEIVRIDLHELAVLQFGQRLLGLPGQVAQYAHHERKLLQLNGAANFDVVGDLYPG
jgi:hypothetical protein